ALGAVGAHGRAVPGPHRRDPPAHPLARARPKTACHATLTAAALETHRRASEQSHVLVGEALPEQLFHRAPEQLRHAEALDPPLRAFPGGRNFRSEEHTSELQSHLNLVCRLLLEKTK